jgi:hypothetical protein
MRRRCAAIAAALFGCGVALADPSAAERARIDKLLRAFGSRRDVKFVRNGKEYTAAQAAEFMNGKLQWHLERVATVQDFIAVVGTRSSVSGDVYRIRLADGRTVPCADFLREELARIEGR